MKNRICLIYLSVMFLLSSCLMGDDTTKDVSAFFQKKGIVFEKELECCVILPEVGCAGCIASGVSFFLENKAFFANSQKKNLIVFTSVNSQKMLLRTLELDSLQDFYCHLDLKNDYSVDGDNSIYPLVLYLKNGKIVKAEFQSPYSGDVIEQLERKLRK